MNRQLVAFLSLFSLTLVLSVYYVLIPTAKIDNTIPETEKPVNGVILDAESAYFETLNIEREAYSQNYFASQNAILASNDYSNTEKEQALINIENYQKEQLQIVTLENCVKGIGYQNVFVEYINDDIRVITSCINEENKTIEAAQIIFTIQDLLDEEENIFVEFHS